MSQFHSTTTKATRFNSQSLFLLQEKSKKFNNLKIFFLFTPILFFVLSLLSPLQSAGQDDFEITMTLIPPTNLYNYNLAFSSSNPCLVCNRVCWKQVSGVCQPLTLGPSNLLPFSLLGSDWHPNCPEHKFRITDTCNNTFIEVIKIIDKKWSISCEFRSACDSYTWIKNGVTYTASGIYTHTYETVPGDTTESTLNLTINNSTSNTTNATACDSYTWSANGVTYTASGIYTHTSLNAVGCDSVSTLNLTINNSTSNTSTAFACGSFTWACNGSTYTTSGMYTCTSMNAAGCVHTEILNLTITAVCSTCICPTLSQWGLMFIALLSIAIGMIFIYKKETALAFAHNSVSSSDNPKLFNSYYYFKALGILSIFAFIGLIISYLYYSELTLTDAFGTSICTLVIAYIVQLYWVIRNKEHEHDDFE